MTEYRRRCSEIVRVSPELALGGGQVPSVLVPQRLPQADLDEGAEADAHVLDDGQFSADSHNQRSPGSALPLCLAGDEVGDQAGLVLLDIATEDPVADLRAQLSKLPEQAIVGINNPGPLEATRAYRLLTACDDALFDEAEAQEAGTGIRHAIAIALPTRVGSLTCECDRWWSAD